MRFSEEKRAALPAAKALKSVPLVKREGAAGTGTSAPAVTPVSSQAGIGSAGSIEAGARHWRRPPPSPHDNVR